MRNSPHHSRHRTATAERIDHGELTEDHAQRIGKQILRDNALSLFPQLKARLWKGKIAVPGKQRDE
jgi:hypothetical protein